MESTSITAWDLMIAIFAGYVTLLYSDNSSEVCSAWTGHAKGPQRDKIVKGMFSHLDNMKLKVKERRIWSWTEFKFACSQHFWHTATVSSDWASNPMQFRESDLQREQELALSAQARKLCSPPEEGDSAALPEGYLWWRSSGLLWSYAEQRLAERNSLFFTWKHF